jgi:hypothetical protein
MHKARIQFPQNAPVPDSVNNKIPEPFANPLQLIIRLPHHPQTVPPYNTDEENSQREKHPQGVKYRQHGSLFISKTCIRKQVCRMLKAMCFQDKCAHMITPLP